MYGDEPFLRGQAIRRLLDQLLAPEERGMCLAEYEATAELAALLDDVRTLPFLGPRRVVILRDADLFLGLRRTAGGESKETGAGGGPKETAAKDDEDDEEADASESIAGKINREALEKYAENPCATGVLILECRRFASNLRLHKRIAALGGCIPCDAPKPWKMWEWLIERCRAEHGKKLDADAAKDLVEHVGPSMGMLDGELGKLAVYVGNRPRITVDDVEKLVGHDREQKVFGMLDAMADGDMKTAMRLWEEVWETDRAAPARSIGGIAFGVRQYLAAHQQMRAGASAYDVARLIKGDPARAQGRIRAFAPDRLRRLLVQLAEADLAAKTGVRSVQTSVERFIVENTVRRGR